MNERIASVMKDMPPVAILAGGMATRLRPLTDTIPKALVDVNGEPFIAHQLRLLRANGIGRVVVCVGYLGEMIQAYVGGGASFGLQIEFSFDGPTLVGTAGAIRKALPLLGETFFVTYGDSYLPCDYWAIRAEFVKSGRLALMTVFRNENRWDASNVEFADGRIVAYSKRERTRRMRHIDYGLSVFRRAVFDGIPAEKPYDLAVVYQDLLKRGQLVGLEVADRFYEIGSSEGLQETRQYLATRAVHGGRGAR